MCRLAYIGVAGAHGLQRAEWLILAVAAPMLLFPGRYVWLGATLIGTSWLARRVARGQWTIRTRVDRFVLLLGLTLMVSLVPSIRLDYSMPKFWGLILGLATLYAVVNTCRNDRALRLAEWALIAGGAGLAVLGLVGIATPPDKLIDDQDVYTSLPRLISSVQSSTVVTQGIHPNELAGVLVLLVPLAFVRATRDGLLRWPALASAALMTVALVLTQSRAALLGVVVTAFVGAVAAFGRRGLITATVLLVVGAQALIQLQGLDHLRQQLLGDAPSAGIESLSGRVELWQRGLAMAVDMPLTGIGLNTFPVVLQTYYPTILISRSQFTLVPHVHNLYLQTFLDLGVIGLFAWLAITVAAIRSGLAAIRARTNARVPAALLLGLVAHAIYSLVDAVTLGAKPGVVLWFVLGLLLALGARAVQSAGASSSSPTARMATNLGTRPRLRWRLAAAAVVLLVAPVLAASAALNAAVLLVHRSAPVDSAFVMRDLQFAHLMAVGPLIPRVHAAESVLANQRGDTAAEMAALSRAQSTGNWDASLGLRLGDLRLATGDRAGAVEAWRAADALPSLLDRASKAPADRALDWYSLAQRLDPMDWRAYAGVGRIVAASDPNRAAFFISEALRLRQNDAAHRDIAQRLVNPAAPLPNSSTSRTMSQGDAELLESGARLLLARQDLSGALLYAQLSTRVAPKSKTGWITLASVLERVGRFDEAIEARSRANLLS